MALRILNLILMRRFCSIHQTASIISANTQRKLRIAAPSRRPGSELYVFDIENRETHVIPSQPGRHFFGHGTYSHDGRLYYTTENDYEGERGLIGVYDVEHGYKHLTEWDAGGIGAHQLKLSPNGKEIVVSNGGILTHPDMGRAKLNLDTMRPNITRLDVVTGTILSQHEIAEDLHQLSIRHMDIAKDGTVYVGMQDQEKNRRDVPLVWKLDHDELMPMEEPKQGWQIFNGYVGSVCTDKTGKSLCVSSPRGNTVHVWNDGVHQSIYKDVCGVAAAQKEGFLFTTGQGKIIHQDGSSKKHNMRFDNHCTAV